MSKRYIYKFASRYDENEPNNGFEEETDYVDTDGIYDFEDWLHDNGINYEEDENCKGFYWVLADYEVEDKETGEREYPRTGAVYMVIDELNNLKRIRTEMRYSQSQLAKESGVEKAMIQFYEQGVRDINKAQAITLYKLAKALECSVEDLLELQ